MTVIIGYRDSINNIMYMGCDTLVAQSDYIKYNLDSKIQVFEDKKLLIGYAGHLSLVQYVMLNICPPEINHLDDFYYTQMLFKHIKELIDEVIREEEVFGALICHKHNLYDIDERGVFRKINNDFHAIGSGEKVALGSLYTSYNYPHNTVQEKINLALDITSKIIWNVQEPFIIEKIKY